MAQRKKIVIPFLTNYTLATGVVIYLINLVKNFNLLEDRLKPSLVLLYGTESPIEEIKQINYPYIKYEQLDKPSLLTRVINKFGLVVFDKILMRNCFEADYVYPAFEDTAFEKIKVKVFWKEDFQESYYPENFTESDLAFVANFFKSLTKRQDNVLVLSSNSAGNDLKRFYTSVNNRVYYLHFVSLIPKLDESRLLELKGKFSLGTSYFMVCNQFWPHKNHSIIVRAVKELVKMGYTDFKVVMTGKTTSYRNTSYFPELQKLITENDLEKYFCTTGFLQREDQLLLMKHCTAVIQPSLFEGWSTVIEDAKALNKYVLASDLEVNQEQITTNVSFFGRYNHEQLADAIESVLRSKPLIQPLDYTKNITAFHQELRAVFDL